MSEAPHPALVSRELSRRIDALVSWLGLAPADKRGNVFTPLNPTRGDRNPGSFVIYGAGHPQAGGWVDYAVPGAAGSKNASLSGDALDLCAYIRTGDPRDRKAGYQIGLEFLGWEGAKALNLPKQAARRRALERDREIAEKNAADELAQKRGDAFHKWTQDAVPNPRGLVWRYLEGRGIDLGIFLEQKRLPGAIRERAGDWHRESGRKLTSMASLIVGPAGKGWAVHRTFLEERDGCVVKAAVDPPRKIWPGGFWGGAIRLSKGVHDCSPEQASRDGLTGETLAIGEGVETMLSVALACPKWRCWAAGNVGAIGAVFIPDCVETVLLVGENDDSREAQRAFELAVMKQAQAAKRQGFKLYRVKPPAGIDDFNTHLQMLRERFA